MKTCCSWQMKIPKDVDNDIDAKKMLKRTMASYIKSFFYES